jgi:hypothetical protein
MLAGMRTPTRLSIPLALVACAATVSGAPGTIPDPVKKTVERVLGKSARIGKEGSGANLVYEASVKTALEVVVGPDGTLRETEVEVPVAALPSAVARAVTARLGAGATVLEAEVVITDAGVAFEVEGRAGGTVVEYRVDGAGTILAEDPDDDDADGSDDDEP